MEYDAVPDGITVHWVLDQITFQQRSRQRCAWCGALVEDKYWPEIPIPQVEGKTTEEVAQEMFNGTWGGWVGIDANGLRFQVSEGPNGEPPRGACVGLPPESTP